MPATPSSACITLIVVGCAIDLLIEMRYFTFKISLTGILSSIPLMWGRWERCRPFYRVVFSEDWVMIIRLIKDFMVSEQVKPLHMSKKDIAWFMKLVFMVHSLSLVKMQVQLATLKFLCQRILGWQHFLNFLAITTNCYFCCMPLFVYYLFFMNVPLSPFTSSRLMAGVPDGAYLNLAWPGFFWTALFYTVS